MKRLSNPESLDGNPPESARQPSFGEAFLFWLKLGFISLGGPTGQIAVMHTELVEKKKWIQRSAIPSRAQLTACFCRALRHSNWPPMSGGFCTRLGVALLRGLRPAMWHGFK